MTSVALGDILELRYGKALKEADRSGGDVPVVGSGGIVGGHSVGITDAPTIVVGRKGSIGSVTWVDGSAWPIDTAYFVTPRREDIVPRWAYWMLKSLRLETMNKSAAVPGLSRDDVYRLNVALPSLPEQRRIAAILDQADAIRTKRREAIACADDLPQSIFHHMFSRSDWPEEPLAEVVDDGTLVTYGIVQAGEEFAGGVPYIRTGDIVDGRIVSAGLRRTDPAIAAKFERSRVRAGDVVMSIRATVGTTAVVPREIDGANLTQGTARIAPSRRALGPYLLAYLRSETAQRWIQAQVKGATFREITLGRLRQLPVPVPPTQLQQDFKRRIGQVEAGREVGVRALHASEELCTSLQSRAFRGEL